MNITLIGMPAVGKSFLGEKLSQRLGYRFVDTDKLIEAQEREPLQVIIDKGGDKNFIKLEQQATLGLQKCKKTVIAPGGSIVYSDKAMQCLKNISHIVFLDAPLVFIEERLSNRQARGIVGLLEKGLTALYEERQPLYASYADTRIFVDNEAKEEEILDIMEKIVLKKAQ